MKRAPAIVSSQQMKELDRRAIEDYGIPSLLLMENAGRGVAEVIFNIARPGRVTIFVGKGNNGGDGLVTARHLHNRGFQVFVAMLSNPSELKNDPALNYGIISKMKIPTTEISTVSGKEDLLSTVEKSDVIVDAIFGVGLQKSVGGVFKSAIESINEKGRTVVSVDVPSGLDADTGEILGSAVRATHTTTLGLPKKGLFAGNGPDHAGKICVIDIGIPAEELKKMAKS